VAGRHDALGDARNLVRRLSWPKNNFRKALAQVAVVIDTGEPEVLERRLAQKLKKPLVRCLRRNGAGAHVVQEALELQTVHRSKWLARVDFGPSRAVRSTIVLVDGIILL
jgi:hypothetical protein